MSIVVRSATADEVRRLRRDVLRPGGTLDPTPYDLMPTTMHLAALDGDRVVGCVTVFPAPLEDEPAAWQLRGMAVEPGYQGRGIGAAVLLAAVEAVEATGAPLVWANGRVTAMAFYQRHGWEPQGEVFTYGPAELPHLVIRRLLSGVRRTVS